MERKSRPLGQPKEADDEAPKTARAVDGGHCAITTATSQRADEGFGTSGKNARKAPKSSLWRIRGVGAANGRSRRPDATWGVLGGNATVPPYPLSKAGRGKEQRSRADFLSFDVIFQGGKNASKISRNDLRDRVFGD